MTRKKGDYISQPDSQSAQSGQIFDDEGLIKNEADTICFCTDARRVIPAEDSEIFNGRMHRAEIKLLLAGETTKYLTFITPPATAENPLYVVWGKDAIKADVNNVDYRLFENVTFTEGGAQPIINPCRPLSELYPAQSQLFNNSTNVSLVGAIEISLDVILGSQGTARSIGGGSAGDRFMVLLPSTKYALEIINHDSQPTNLLVKSFFLEALFPKIWDELHL